MMMNQKLMYISSKEILVMKGLYFSKKIPKTLKLELIQMVGYKGPFLFLHIYKVLKQECLIAHGFSFIKAL